MERRSQEGECSVLTCKNDHVHAPEYTHDPAHHDDGSEDLDEGSSDVQPEDTAHVPVGEVGAGPAEHGEGRHERPWGESTTQHPLRATASCQIPPLRPAALTAPRSWCSHGTAEKLGELYRSSDGETLLSPTEFH